MTPASTLRAARRPRGRVPAQRHDVVSVRICCLLALALLALVSGCARQQPLYVDPAFSGRELRDGATAFLISAHVDLGAVASQLGPEFAGRSAVAESLIIAVLGEHLQGQRMATTGRGQAKLDFADAGETTDPLRLHALMGIHVDEVGRASLRVPDPGALADELARKELDFLIVVRGLTVVTSRASLPRDMRDASLLGGAGPSRGEGDQAWLCGHVFVWSRTRTAVLWHGVVVGGKALGRAVTADTLENATSRFAGNLRQALL